MAQDIFAPKTSFDIGYEKPQQGVTDNTAKIAADFEAMALGAQARAVQGQAQLESNQFRALDMGLKIGAQSYDAYVDSQEKLAVSTLIKEFRNIDAQDAEKGLPYETKRARYTNAIGKAGQSMPGGMVKLGKYGAIIKNATGIDMGEVQKDPSQAMYETMLKDPMFYSAFQASKLEQPNLTQEERFLKAQQFAIANAAVQLESTTLDLQSLDSYNKKGKRVVDNVILNTEKYIKGSMQTKIEQGIPVTTEDIEILEQIVQNTQLQVAKMIPPSAPESERNYYDNIFTQLDGLLKEVKDTKDPGLILRGLASGLTQLAQDEGDITGMAAGAMFADLNLLTTADGINTYIESIKKQSDGTYKPSRISGGNADQIMDMITKDYEGTVGPNTALSSEELGPLFDATGLGIDDLDSLRKSGLGLIKDLNIGKVSTEKGKKQLTAGVADITKSLNFLDLQQTGLQLKVLLEDSGMLDLIDALDSQDRALANNLRTLMTSAVTNNLRFSEQKVAVIEREGVGASNRKPGLVWDENTKTYYATDESYIDFLKGKKTRRGYLVGTDAEAERRIESLLNEKGLPLARSSDLVNEDISKAYKHREVIEVANRVLDRIRVEEANEDISAVEEVAEPTPVRDVTPLGESRVNLLNNDEIFKVVSDALDAADTSANTGMLSDSAVKQEVAKLLGLTTNETTTDTTIDDDADEVQPDSGKELTPVRDITPLGEGARDIEAQEYAEDMFKVSGTNVTPDIDKVKDFAKDTYKNPVQAAAFVATVEAESGTALVERDYSKKRAIEVFVDRNKKDDGTLGPKMQKRKTAIEALPDNHTGDDIFDIVYEGRLGNRTGTNDGSRYKGRGLIQITGRDTYKKLGEKIGVDLLNNPELLETDKNIMLSATIAYLQDKDFSTSDLTEAKLASIIGHSDDNNNTVAQTRWNSTKKVYKEMFGEELE
jgi:predicted chitinase